MTPHFADRLTARCEQVGAPVCVGIDPVYERLPAAIVGDGPAGAPDNAHEAVEAIYQYAMGVIEAVAPHAACVKLQSACFERYLWPGLEAYHQLVHYAQERDLIVIGDVKRGDIGLSSAHYAAGCLADSRFDDLGRIDGPDAVTVNAYLGDDGIGPFVDMAAGQGKGVFALVRTSNPGGDAVQGLRLDDGRTVAQAVGELIAQLGSGPGLVGQGGYSLLGAVVGATKADDIAQLRQTMPQQLFLVPGFGAQGGSASDVKACFKPDGTGAVITASRSVIYAYEKNTTDDWRSVVEQAAIEFKQQVQAICG
jgi:orotidine-5'-phosphate decarboxylase